MYTINDVKGADWIFIPVNSFKRYMFRGMSRPKQKKYIWRWTQHFAIVSPDTLRRLTGQSEAGRNGKLVAMEETWKRPVCALNKCYFYSLFWLPRLRMRWLPNWMPSWRGAGVTSSTWRWCMICKWLYNSLCQIHTSVILGSSVICQSDIVFGIFSDDWYMKV